MRGNMRRNYVTYKGVKRMNYAIRNAERNMGRVESNNTNRELTDEEMGRLLFILFLMAVVVSTVIYLIVVS